MSSNKNTIPTIPVFEPPQQTHTPHELHAARALIKVSCTGQPSLRKEKRAADRRIKRAAFTLSKTHLDNTFTSSSYTTTTTTTTTTNTATTTTVTTTADDDTTTNSPEADNNPKDTR